MQTIMNSIEFYAEQTQNVSIKLEEYEKKANVFTYARLIVLLIAVPLAVFASYLSPYAIASVLVLGLIAFVYAVIQQQKFEGLSRRMRNLLSIIEHEEACISHHKNRYHNGDYLKTKHHAFAGDLDVFGDNSLFHLLNRSKTFFGMIKLAKVLIQEPINGHKISQRQKAVQEIESDPEWKLRC